MNSDRFARVEQRIEQLVEGGFARLFAGRLHPREVAVHLARALEDNARPGPNGVLLAPNVFVVSLNPEDREALLAAQPNLSESLVLTVIDLAYRAGMRLIETPSLQILPDPSLALRMVTVTARYEEHTIRSTQALQPVKAAPQQALSRNPQLILPDNRQYALNRQVINIGRRQDNQVVLDDPRISRQHAQLRLRFGRYVLYDLGSSGGTFVNGQAIHEWILKPGDVISLAGVALVYVEDDTSPGSRAVDHPKTETALKRPRALKRADDDSTL